MNIDGWIARNGAIVAKDGMLTLSVDANAPKNARPFIANSNLNLAGPVTATLRIRARTEGQGPAKLTWRTKQDSFAEHQSSTFNWPTGAEWQEVQIELSEASRIIHIRIHPPQAATGIEIDSIEFKGRDSVTLFDFNSVPK